MSNICQGFGLMSMTELPQLFFGDSIEEIDIEQ